MKIQTLTVSALGSACAVLLGSVLLPGTATAAPEGARDDRVTVAAGKTVTVKPLANDRVPAKRRAKLTVIKTDPALTWERTGKRITVLPDTDSSAGTYVIKYRVVSVSAGKRFRDTAKIKVVVTAIGTAAPTATPTATPTVSPTPAATATPTSTPTLTATPTPTSTPTPTPTPTATPTPTSTPAANSLPAMIEALPVAVEVRTGYDRATWKHWNSGSAGISYCDTRDEVLISESTVQASWSGTSCALTGSWYSYYDGVSTTDAGTFDIDHMVALAEAHDSGGYAWSAATKEAYANDQGDPRSLVAVTASSNRGKGDQEPRGMVAAAGALPLRSRVGCREAPLGPQRRRDREGCAAAPGRPV